MATETVISDHTTTDEVEKRVNDEVKTDLQEIVSPSKETEEENQKAKASSSPEAPSKSKEKQEAEKIELPSIIKEIEKTDDSPVVDEEVKPFEQETLSSLKETEDEKPEVEEVKAVEQQTISLSNETEEEMPKAADSGCVEAPSPKAEEKMEDKQIEPSPEQEALSSMKETEEEKLKIEEVKAIEQETIYLSKETEEEKPKAAELQSLEASSPEVEEKMEDKQIEPSQAIKEVEKTGDAYVSDEVETIEQEKVEEKVEDKQIEPSPEQETLSSVKETEEEKSEVEEVKAVEQQTISPSKEAEKEIPKAAGLCSLEAPSPEAEEKMEDKQIEPSPEVKEVEKTNDSPVVDREVTLVGQETLSLVKETEEQKSKIEEVKAVEQEIFSSYKETEEEKTQPAESQSIEAPSPEVEEKMEDKQIEPFPVIKEVEKTNNSPVVDQEVKQVEQETLSLVKKTEEEISKVEEVKAVEQETISPYKETEEEKPKAAESQSLEASSPEVEEKMEDKQIEPSQAIKEVEKTGDAYVSDEVKTIEQETISPSKETEEELKGGEFPSPKFPSSELEEKMVDEQIEPPTEIKEVEKIGDAPLSGEEVKIIELETISPSKEAEEEKLKAEKVGTVELEMISPSQETEEPKDAESPSPEAPSSKSEEKMVGMQTETSIIKEVENAGDTPVLDVPVEDNSTVAKESFPDADILSVPEPVVQPAVESVEEQPSEKPAAESIEKQSGEKAKIVDSPESSFEAIKETEEPLEVSPVKESEAVVKEREGSGSGSIKVEKHESEEPKATEKVYTESEIKPEERMEIEIAKEKEILADMVEDTIALKEEQTKKDQESFPSATADQIVLINQEAQADPTGDGGESSLPHISEKEVMELEKIKEDEAKDVKTEGKNEEHVITKELIQPEALKVEEVSSSVSNAEVTEKLFERENVKTEDYSKDNVSSEISTPPKKITIEDAGSSLATTEVTAKLFEGENTSRDVKEFSEYKKEEALPSVQTDKEKVEGKLHEVTSADIVRQSTESPETEMEVKGEPQETELELKEEETAKANTDELEKEKEADEAAKSDVQLESAKDGVHENTSQDQPNQEVSAKPAQKQSNTIMSKVKQSLVKAKKAITGKSSKSTQRDIKVSSV